MERKKCLIIGRSASGKDYLAGLLKNMYHWTFVKSYTTRPKRYPEEDTHLFISQQEALQFPERRKAAITKIGEFEYFATRESIEECNGYIVDPIGFYQIIQNMPDTQFVVVYVWASREGRLQKALERVPAEKVAQEIRVFKRRDADEDEQFTRFENTWLSTIDYSAPNVEILQFSNFRYDKKLALAFAEYLHQQISV